MIDPLGAVNGPLRNAFLVLGDCAVHAGPMDSAPISFWATLVVIAAGSLWGFYWITVREIDGLGVTGAWGTVAIVGAAMVLLVPLGWRGRVALLAPSPVALLSVALGGFGRLCVFALFRWVCVRSDRNYCDTSRQSGARFLVATS